MRRESVVHAKLASMASESLLGFGILGLGRVGCPCQLYNDLCRSILLLAILLTGTRIERRGGLLNNA